eukprot:10983292-Lingulodinium_polyedra.AAC.1
MEARETEAEASAEGASHPVVEPRAVPFDACCLVPRSMRSDVAADQWQREAKGAIPRRQLILVLLSN